MDPLDALNEEQRAAASHTEGAVLILAVTFTNKAAGEMRSRLHQLVRDQAHGLWVGTFHAIGVRILRRDGKEVGVAPNFVIYDDADQRTLIREVLRDLNIDERHYHPGAVLHHISHAKERLLDPAAYAQTADGEL